MSDTGTGPEAERITTIENLSDKVDRLATAVSQVLAGKGPAAAAHEKAEDATEDRLGRPSTVEEQVAAALEARDREARQAQLHEDVASAKADLAALKEKPPETPIRKIERIMGWREA